MQRCHRTRTTWCLILCAGILSLGGPAAAQTAILDPIPTDATIHIVNATTGQPARADHVLLRDPSPTLWTIAEDYRVDGEVTFAGQMLYNYKRYVATAWVDGVAYHAEQRGQGFLDGKPLIVHCFSTTDDLDGVTMTGMNVVVRQRQDGFSLEYVMIVANESRPQHTIDAGILPVQLTLPAGIERLQVEVGSDGLDSRKPELKPIGGGRHGVAVALTPGVTRLTVRGVLAGVQRTELTVATNLGVEAWSLLAWPAELKVQSFGLEHDRQNEYPEFSRWRGQSLTPGQQVRVTIEQVLHLADLLPEQTPDPEIRQPSSPRPDHRRGFPWRTTVAAVVLIGLYLFWRSRR